MISDKYRIDVKSRDYTFNSINSVGFDDAIQEAFDCALKVIDKDPKNLMATTFLCWSNNLLEDARRSDQEQEKLLLLVRFYRVLAHKIYWHQHKKGKIGYIKDFLQAV